MRDELNLRVIRYALRTIYDNSFSWCTRFHRECIPAVMDLLNKAIPNKRAESNAKVRTQGLSESFVVATCGIDRRAIAYSDYSGKKQRQTVLGDFSNRRHSFRIWYNGNSKPYQHIDLYNRINKRLGRIGAFTQNVKHPIGYCAEQNVANRLLLDCDDNIDDIQFSVAIRPRTGEVVDYCGNCKALFNV